LEFEESTILANAWRVLKADEMFHAFSETGKIYYQEESSQLVGKAVRLEAGESFLDVCAAPGSKTTLINFDSQNLNSVPARFVAGDKYLHRLRVLRETCRRTGSEKVELAAYDAENRLPFADESFDCVLVDAPCTGTGTIRHNPEIRYFLKSEDFAELPEKQLRILENASKVLKKGGRLIYSTCSLEISENESVVEKFLAKKTEFQKTVPAIPSRFLTEKGFARTFTPDDQTDGFFIAALTRAPV
jgi:16S rRNA (cytosine967-C5)-methyltransferase